MTYTLITLMSVENLYSLKAYTAVVKTSTAYPPTAKSRVVLRGCGNITTVK